MDQIKRWYRSVPIWLALFLFITLALLVAFLLSGKITALFDARAIALQLKYVTITQAESAAPDESGVIYDIDEGSADGVREVQFNYDRYSGADWRMLRFCRFALRCVPFFIYALCILTAVLLFYFTKLKKPLNILMKASDKIADNELDCSLEYAGNDEMAKLCAAFEKMRAALDENNQRMLRMIDERGLLNDAYTHDLRTPIAILKGYTDMLVKYIPTGQMQPEEVLETVKTMSAHVQRLEQFVDSMNTVQKLEHVELCREETAAGEFLEHLRASAALLCQSNGVSCVFEAAVGVETLYIDSAAVIQVFENLMSNAVRFARAAVIVRCTVTADGFYMDVSDDGAGFLAQELSKADKPYYSGGAKKDGHFGLGLYICRILCARHGGGLRLENAPQGGACVTAWFRTCEKASQIEK